MTNRVNYSLGAIVSLAGSLLGIVGFLWLFTEWWPRMFAAEMAKGRPDEAFIVTFIIPALNDVGIIGSVVLAVAAWGFFKQKTWAWGVGMAGIVLMMQGSFFPMIPAASSGLAPMYAILFVPVFAMYLIMTLFVRKVDGKIVTLSIVAGMTYVLTFMNGIAATNRIWLSIEAHGLGDSLFVAVERLNWYAAIAWGVFVVALLMQQKWALPVGIGAGIMGFAGGILIAYVSMASHGGFSMFTAGPIFSGLLLVMFLLPKGQKVVTDWVEKE